MPKYTLFITDRAAEKLIFTRGSDAFVDCEDSNGEVQRYLLDAADPQDWDGDDDDDDGDDDGDVDDDDDAVDGDETVVEEEEI